MSKPGLWEVKMMTYLEIAEITGVSSNYLHLYLILNEREWLFKREGTVLVFEDLEAQRLIRRVDEIKSRFDSGHPISIMEF